jgi:hypothetical protein
VSRKRERKRTRGQRKELFDAPGRGKVLRRVNREAERKERRGLRYARSYSAATVRDSMLSANRTMERTLKGVDG